MGIGRILVVAAHPDDELLGTGATVRRLVDEGAEAHALILAEGATSRAAARAESDPALVEALQADARAAAEVVGYSSIRFCGFPDNRMDGVELLDVVKAVSGAVERLWPDTVFTHHHGDLNVDHRLACEAALTACRPVGDMPVRRVLAFETPSSTEWDFTQREPFRPNVFFDVSLTVEAKVAGMACYRSESAAAPHPRSPESLRALAAWRGSAVGCAYAEAFEVLREVL